MSNKKRFIFIIGKLAANFYFHFHSVAVCHIIVIEKHMYIIFLSSKKLVPILHIIKHKINKSYVTLYLRNERALRVGFGICHKQNIGL